MAESTTPLGAVLDALSQIRNALKKRNLVTVTGSPPFGVGEGGAVYVDGRQMSPEQYREHNAAGIAREMAARLNKVERGREFDAMRENLLRVPAQAMLEAAERAGIDTGGNGIDTLLATRDWNLIGGERLRSLVDAAEATAQLLARKLASRNAGDSRADSAATPATKSSRFMRWQDAITTAKKHLANRPFPGLNELADEIGCSRATISKARDNDPELKAKFEEYMALSARGARRSVKAGQFTELQEKNLGRSDDPGLQIAADEFVHKLINQYPDRRAELNEMNDEQRCKFYEAHQREASEE